MRTLFAATVACMTIVGLSHADDSQASIRKTFSIPAQELGAALQSLSKEHDVHVVFMLEDVQQLSTQGVSGEMTVDEALGQLLNGTGLRYERVDSETVTIVPVGAAPAADNQSGADKTLNDLSLVVPTAMRLAQTDSAEKTANADNNSFEASKGAREDKGKIQEIVVTAQKREQKLQDVPQSISALTTADIERTGVQGMQDFLALVPGVSYNDVGRGRSVITMRGISMTTTTTANASSTVELYLDELPLTDRVQNWSQSDVNTFDLERVEVLRGPQGTLFGSGSIGGAIRWITNKPNLSEIQGKLETGIAATEGGDDSSTLNAMVNLPLINNKLGLRAVGYRRRDGGYIDNVVYGTKDTNSGASDGGRLMLGYQATDALGIRLSAIYDQQILDDDPNGFRFSSDGGPYEAARFGPYNLDAKMQQYNLNVDYDLGFAQFNSSSTYGQRDSVSSLDLLVPIIGAFYAGGTWQVEGNEDTVTRTSKRFTQEFRLASAGDGPLEWTAGLFWLDYEFSDHKLWVAGSPTPILALLDQQSTKVIEKAVYGELTYHLTDAWRFTVGGRYFENTFEDVVTSDPAAVAGGGYPYIEFDSSEFTPKFSVSYVPNDNFHVYATASSGYRIGQTNGNAGLDPRIPQSYAPDSLWNYELGVKSNLFDRRLMASVAAFYIDWSDIHVNRFLLDGQGQAIFTTPHTANAGTAEIKGVEAELIARPHQALEVGTSLTYTDATLKSVLPGATGLVPGSTLPGTPEFAATTYIQATHQFGNSTGYLRITHRYSGSAFSDIDNTRALTMSDAYNKVDLRTGLIFDRYEVLVYANNLLNSDAVNYARGEAVPPSVFGPGFEAYVTRLVPRTVGATLRINF